MLFDNGLYRLEGGLIPTGSLYTCASRPEEGQPLALTRWGSASQGDQQSTIFPRLLTEL